MRNQIDIDFSTIMQEIENVPHDNKCHWYDNRDMIEINDGCSWIEQSVDF